MEYIYFDEPTTKMLLSKDNDKPAEGTPNFGMDDMGTLHIIYRNDGKVIRDFVIPSDPEPTDTEKQVILKMEESMAQRRNVNISLWAVVISLSALLLTFAIAVLNYIT